MSPGFKRDELRNRYDVARIAEDRWHSYSGERASELIADHFPRAITSSQWLLNAGAGVYEIGLSKWKEIAVDLFTTPLLGRHHAICANIEHLPLHSCSLGGIVCVGEVLAYCDPAAAIKEFSRVLIPSGVLLCDFGSSRSFQYWFQASYRRSADLVTDSYNGTPERTWIYDPSYVGSLLTSNDFHIKAKFGTHTWSALARRIGISTTGALFLQRHLERIALPSSWGHVTTILAVRTAAERGWQ